MPPRMGDFHDLQILTEFVLDTDGHNAVELKKLQNLRGTLCISGLWKVVNGRGLVANIVRDKKFLTGLTLDWGYLCHKDDMVLQREVLEKLQHHLSLEKLTIKFYGGQLFPDWSGYYNSSALFYLQLANCANCISLPPLGQLPSCNELHIYGLHEVVSIGPEFYYGDGITTCVNKPFRCLRSLKFENMNGWKEWSYVGGDDNEGGVFPNLVQLHISDCPNLTGRLGLDSFPMLKEVDLDDTKLSLVTRSPDSKLSCLESLLLQWCPNIVSFPDGGLNAPNLTTLRIRSCPVLRRLPDGGLPASLKILEIGYCRALQCLPDSRLPDALDRLDIYGCPLLHFKGARERRVKIGPRFPTSPT